METINTKVNVDKHTQGKWELRGNKIFITGTYISIATVHIQKSWDEQIRPIEDTEAIANAKLIRAAPELMEVLKQLCNSMGNIAAEMIAYDKAQQLLNNINESK